MINPNGTWHYPTQMRFGRGRINELPECCKELGMSNPLLVTDTGLAEDLMISAAQSILSEAGVKSALFSGVKGNPIGKNVLDGVTAYKKGEHNGVVVIGGGSAMDVAKTIAMYQGQSDDLFDLHVTSDSGKVINGTTVSPIIAVPTTAGTGSETGRASVITDEADHAKRIFAHPKMMPSIVISDAELTVGLPKHLSAWTGLDALAHNFEAYCAPGTHPMADGIAVEGMRLVKEYLPRVIENGGDVEARAYMLAAASMGSTAFQKGLGAIHSLSHPVGAVYDTHHGLTNAVFFPYVMIFNRPAIEDRLDRLAAYLGLGNSGFNGMLDWVLEFREQMEIPHTLQGLDIDDAKVDEIAAAAVVDPTAEDNPIPLTVENMREVYVNALEGTLG